MHHENSAAGERARTVRPPRPSLDPYDVDDVALTYSDVMRARALDRRPGAAG